MKSQFRCKSVILPGAIESDRAMALYGYLKDNVVWEEGVRSKKGFTRKAKPASSEEYPDINEIIGAALKRVGNKYIYVNLGMYINYYEDGKMWCPNHTHPGTHQMVISLGATRDFVLGKKTIKVNNGDICFFGSAVHGVPKDEGVKEGRISIAILLQPIA